MLLLQKSYMAFVWFAQKTIHKRSFWHNLCYFCHNSVSHIRSAYINIFWAYFVGFMQKICSRNFV